MGEYICDDRVDRIKLTEAIKNMTDDEFEKFNQTLIKTNAYPLEYYIQR